MYSNKVLRFIKSDIFALVTSKELMAQKIINNFGTYSSSFGLEYFNG